MYGQEHLGSVYRAWRDHLSRCLDEFTHFDEAYTLLHTASLVGLFSCIFIKASLRSRVKDVEAAEIKTGMGGLHGNKVSTWISRVARRLLTPRRVPLSFD